MVGPQIPALASFVEPIDRPGVDGEAFRQNANKVAAIEIFTKQWVTTLTAANLAIDYYSALKGYTVTVVDDLGRTINNVMVLDVRVNAVQTILTSSPTGYTHQVSAVWYLKPTA